MGNVSQINAAFSFAISKQALDFVRDGEIFASQMKISSKKCTFLTTSLLENGLVQEILSPRRSLKNQIPI